MREVSLRVNERIRAREVRLIDSDGQQIGIVTLEQALATAADRGLDLVEVAPQARPPVCRICDFSKLLYTKKRKQREARKKQRQFDVKEIKMKPRIGPHDYEIKLRHARELLMQGHTVKMTVEVRGRRRVNPEMVENLYRRMLADMADIAHIDENTRQVGRSRSALMTPMKHPPEPQHSAGN